jgi:hypothetical protein
MYAYGHAPTEINKIKEILKEKNLMAYLRWSISSHDPSWNYYDIEFIYAFSDRGTPIWKRKR